MSERFKNPYEASSSKLAKEVEDMAIEDEDTHLDKVLEVILKLLEKVLDNQEYLIEKREIDAKALEYLCNKIPK